MQLFCNTCNYFINFVVCKLKLLYYNEYITYMKTQVFSIKNLRRIVFLAILCMGALASQVSAQIDFEFWFAAPYANRQHNPHALGAGGRPIYLQLASQDAPANIRISMPANPSFVPIDISIGAKESYSLDLTPYIDQIQSSNVGNVIENKGLYIRSDALITAYYEISAVLNGDFFSLKGKNALGTEFFAPLQNMYRNSDHHKIEPGDTYGLYKTVDRAYSYIVIVATENNTQVSITPTGAAVGIPKGTTKNVILNKGQTYVVRSVDELQDNYDNTKEDRLGGTKIVSNKKIAVTIGDDSMFPQNFTEKSNDCEDYAGDQIVPVDVIGKEYWVLKGLGYKSQKRFGVDVFYTEHAFVTATKNNTIVSVNGEVKATLQAGQQYPVDLGGPTESDYTFISATEPIYVFHVSGYQCEMAGALLPSIDLCSGSYKTGFYRTYGTNAYEDFWMNLMVKGDGEDDFLLDGVEHPNIENATWHSIPGSTWKATRIEFTKEELPVGPHFIENNSSLFHVAIMNSRSYKWNESGFGLMGASYGYFSNFNDNEASAIIVNNNDTTITVPKGTNIYLLGSGGREYSWKGYIWDEATDDWAELPPPYFMTNTEVDNPQVLIDIYGSFKYTASVVTECYGIQNRSVYIKVVPPANLNDIYDTVCATPPYINKSEFYNLYNVEDTLIGVESKELGFYVESWHIMKNDETVIWDDAEANRLYSSNVAFNASVSIVSNPAPSSANSSAQVLYIKKNAIHVLNENARYGIAEQDAQLGFYYTLDVSSPPVSTLGKPMLSFNIATDGSSFENYPIPPDFSVDVILINEQGHYVRASSGQILSGPAQPSWKTFTYDFSTAEHLGEISEVKIFAYKANTQWTDGKLGLYIDNITFSTERHLATIQNPTNYTITDGDTILANVKNSYELSRKDTAYLYLTVNEEGKAPKHIQAGPLCADEGTQYFGFDLTAYRYDVGGALVADKVWYYDEALTMPVEDPTDATVTGTQTFWADIIDECGHKGSLTIEITPRAEVHDGQVEICEEVELGGGKGLLDLTAQSAAITTNLQATVDWYADSDRTIRVASPSQVIAEDGNVYYANIYFDEACVNQAKLTVSLIPLSQVSLEDRQVCYDVDNLILEATPVGGQFSGVEVVGNEFFPTVAGVGSHEYSYTISNQSCHYTKKATIVVNPEVTVSITKNPTWKVHIGSVVTLQGTIDPSPSSQYTYSWSNPSLLETPTSLVTATKPLAEPTYFCLTAEDKQTGCADELCVLVDVYAPVQLDLDFSANPVCAGEDVIISAKKSGGYGPFTFVWDIPVGTTYEHINDSVIKVKDPQSTAAIKVTVTDLGVVPNDVMTETDDLVIYPRPVVSIPDTHPVHCEGDNFTIVPVVTNGTPAYTHVWSQNTQILSSSVNSQNASVNAVDNTGTYYLKYTVTDAHDCSASENVAVTINLNPKVEAFANPETTCIGSIVQLSGVVKQGTTAGGTHKWISSTGSEIGLTNAAISNPEFDPTAVGVHKFNYIFTDALGCKDTSSILNVRVEPKPTVTINPIAPLCANDLGQALVANPQVSGVPSATFTYNWTGDVKSTKSSPVLNVSEEGVKNVSLIVTADNGCVSEPANIDVIVYPNPVAEIINLQPIEVCAGEEFELLANNAMAGMVYTWDGSAKPYINPTAGESIIFTAPEIATPTQTYSITMTATNATTGCTSTTESTILVNRKPELTLGGDVELCLGNSIIMDPTITFAVEPIKELRWLLDITELSNTGTLNPTFTLKEDKTYSLGLKVTDANGCIGYDQILINPLQNPVANAGDDKVVSWNDQFSLEGSAAQGTPGYTWKWEKKDSLTSSNTVQNPTAVLKETTWFELEVTDSKGCKDIDSVLITVVGNPISVVITKQPDNVCEGDAATLEAIASGGAGVYQYEWSEAANPSIVIGTGKFLPIHIAGVKEYIVKVSSDVFTPATASYTVSPYAKPVVSIEGTSLKELCLNTSTVITPKVVSSTQGAISYVWNDNSPVTVTTPTYTYNNSATAGTYTINLEVTDEFGCKDEIDITIKVNDLPKVSIEPNNPIVCENNDITVSSVVTGNGKSPYTYTWTSASGNLNPAHDKAFFNSNIVGPHQISVKVVDDNSCTADASKIVIVKPTTTLSLKDSYTVCAGSELILDINPNKLTGLYTMNWIAGDKNIIADSSNILQTVVKTNDVGKFNLTYSVVDENGCPYIGTVTIHVLPTVTLAPIADINSCVSVPVEVQAVILSAGTPANVTYTWFGDVSPNHGKTTTVSALAKGAKSIKLVATEGIGELSCSDSLEFNVTVFENPIVAIQSNVQPNNVPYSANVELVANISHYTTANYSYNWQEAAAITSGQNSAQATTIPITNSRNYSVTITDENGCKATDAITLSTENIIIEIWHPCNESDPVKPNEIVTGMCLDLKNEICEDETIRLVPQFLSGNTDGLSYEWTDGEGNFIANTINITVRPTKKTTIYNLQVTNASGFTADAQYLVVSNPNPIAHITVSPDYNGTYYSGELLTLNGNPSGGSGVWKKHVWSSNAQLQNSGSQITQTTLETGKVANFLYVIEDSKGCKGTDSKQITPTKPHTPGIVGSSSSCEGETVTYSIDETYPPGTVYIWTVEGGQIIGSDSEATADIHWPHATTGKVTVYIKPSHDKELVSELTVTVSKKPNVSISGPGDICQGDESEYIAVNNGSNTNLVYSWAVATDISSPLFEPYYSQWWDGTDDELLQSVSYPVATSASVLWKHEGKDKVVLSARDGNCVTIVDKDVTIHPIPNPNFSYKPAEKIYFEKEKIYRETDSIFVGKLVDFTNETYGTADTTLIDPNVSFYWDFIGDGVFTENEFNSTYIYDEPGQFTVQLLAIDDVWGCKNSIAKPLEVIANPNCGLKFPNAFTPDLTTNNEFFAVYNEGVLETGYELRIFNRWGDLLWKSTDKHAAWDGVYKGAVSKQDVYVYHCKAVCEEIDPKTGKNRVLNIKGDVTIMR